MSFSNPSHRRRALVAIISSIAYTASPNMACAASWPDKPIRVVVPYPPGGPTDTVARHFADRLSRVLGQPVIIENRAGAGGTLGMDSVAHAPPDGSTWGFAAISPLTLSPHLMKLNYDPLRDLVPAASVMYAPVYVVASPSFKGKSFADAVTLAKSSPLGVTIASSGYGSVGHIMIEQLRRQSGANFVHVPYKGGGQIATDAAGGQFDLFLSNPTDAIQGLIMSGKLRLLAIAAPERLPSAPEVPTLAELGYRSANLSSYFGFYAPAGTPADIVNRINVEVSKLLAQAEVRDRLHKLNNVPSIATPAQFAGTIRTEFTANGKIIREANIKAE